MLQIWYLLSPLLAIFASSFSLYRHSNTWIYGIFLLLGLLIIAMISKFVNVFKLFRCSRFSLTQNDLFYGWAEIHVCDLINMFNHHNLFSQAGKHNGNHNVCQIYRICIPNQFGTLWSQLKLWIVNLHGFLNQDKSVTEHKKTPPAGFVGSLNVCLNTCVSQSQNFPNTYHWVARVASALDLCQTAVQLGFLFVLITCLPSFRLPNTNVASRLFDDMPLVWLFSANSPFSLVTNRRRFLFLTHLLGAIISHQTWFRDVGIY